MRIQGRESRRVLDAPLVMREPTLQGPTRIGAQRVRPRLPHGKRPEDAPRRATIYSDKVYYRGAREWCLLVCLEPYARARAQRVAPVRVRGSG